MSKIKIVRFGQWQAHKGVVIIASLVEDQKLYFGVAYSSPKDLYDKKKGRELSIARLEEAKQKGICLDFFAELTHRNVIHAILHLILVEQEYPRWAENLLVDAASYPYGLKRYSSTYNFENGNPLEIQKIVVNSEEAKEQLVMAFEYLHDLRNIDTDFLAVNVLVHQYLHPEIIVVEGSNNTLMSVDDRLMDEEYKEGC